jgi:transcriptional regulator with XRE-family HTH domain
MRRRRGYLLLSQPKVAKLLGVHTTTYARWEHGKASPTIDLAKRLADVLQVPLERLISDGDAADGWPLAATPAREASGGSPTT